MKRFLWVAFLLLASPAFAACPPDGALKWKEFTRSTPAFIPDLAASLSGGALAGKGGLHFQPQSGAVCVGASDWTGVDLAAAQAAVDAAPAETSALKAKTRYDASDPIFKAMALYFLGQVNELRALLGLAPLTPEQARAGIKAKIDALLP